MTSHAAFALRAACLALLTVLAGCGGGASGPEPAAAPGPVLRSPEAVSYRVPVLEPGTAMQQSLAVPYSVVWDRANGALTSSGFEISYLDERQGLIVARYSGEPSSFVDCGTILASSRRGGGSRIVSASQSTASFGQREEERDYHVERALDLEARLTLQFEPAGTGTFVSGEATYVLIKELDIRNRSGSVVDRGVDAIAFQSGERGRFNKGTVCQPTGILERFAVLSTGA